MQKNIKKGLKTFAASIKFINYYLTQHTDLKASQTLDIRDCQTVCLALGPYRNLTTLTAATLFLHPNCQVLNHAGRRIYGNRKVDFLSNFSEERVDHFIQFAIQISRGGCRGSFGGSITHSHAFDSKHKLKEVFSEASLDLTKKQIKCLFWKESLRTSNLIRNKNIDLVDLLTQEERLRFLMPIRHPLDCAKSNLKTGHVNGFRGLNKSSSIFNVLQAVLDEIYWFASYKEKFPSRFFCYFEHSISQTMLVDLATFLKLSPNEVWLSNALSAMVTKSNYEHDSELLDFYRETVSKKFSRFPDLSKELLAFA